MAGAPGDRHGRINAGLVSNPAAPFAGVKQSGSAARADASAPTSSWSTSASPFPVVGHRG
ncbi:hypothetical protein [Streptomyces himalayensis]|uniref:hypothetical protein n=1 Tax=Streptomyces himalayensis TaxID=2820085 RepID=UPI0035A8F423